MPNSKKERSYLVWILIVSMLLLTAGFGWSTWQSHQEFRNYRTQTLENADHPPRWQREVLTPEECVGEAMAWAASCPGVQSWCEAATPEVVQLCLKSRDRSTYCREVGDEVLSTRLGFAACKARYEPIDNKYARRTAKKACASSYRVIARHCRPDATVHMEWDEEDLDKMSQAPRQADESSVRGE